MRSDVRARRNRNSRRVSPEDLAREAAAATRERALAAAREQAREQGREQAREQIVEAALRAAVESGVSDKVLAAMAAATGMSEERAARIIGEVCSQRKPPPMP